MGVILSGAYFYKLLNAYVMHNYNIITSYEGFGCASRGSRQMSYDPKEKFKGAFRKEDIRGRFTSRGAIKLEAT